MRFLLIAGTPQSLPFAVEINEESLSAALAKVSAEEESGYILALFLIDLDSSKAHRLFRKKEGGWAASDTAYDRNLGVATPDEYFRE